MSAATRQLAASAAAALARHVPFDRMDAGLVLRMAEKLAVAYYARGAVIAGPAHGVPAGLRIVKVGSVRGPEGTLEEGECFPVGALLEARAAGGDYIAEGDTFCWELPAADFRWLLDESAEFRAFCTDRLAMLLGAAHRAQLAAAAASLSDTASLLAPLSSVLRRQPVSCGRETPIAEVVDAMHRDHIGSMVVVDAAKAPAGIFTTVDLLERVAAPQLSMQTPVGLVMTPHPFTLEHTAPIIEAALAMARHGFRHVVVARDGALAGVVSERDLFALQRSSLARMAERIRAAQSTQSLAEVAAEIRALAGQLLAQGIAAEQMTRMVTALNDSLVERVVSAAAAAHTLPGQWCWLALGSEGRMEQTLVTDQDNALIFDAAGSPESERRRFIAFADEVNRTLDACGFPLCKGDIMARNPRWCLAPAEWRALFDGWIRNPEPEALLHAAIFFDFRSLAGDARLAQTLRREVLAQARAWPAFRRAMAHNALTARPPLGMLRDFSAAVIDLKLHGARPFVDAARILALAAGSGETGTAARLAAAGEPPSRADAFHFIQRLRLQAGGNEVRVDGLSSIERRVLKEALREAERLQDRLRADYP